MSLFGEPFSAESVVDTPPRQHAAQIRALSTLEQRREALERVPPHLRGLVETYLRLAWERRRELLQRDRPIRGGMAARTDKSRADTKRNSR